MNLQALKSQKVSESGYTKIVNELRKKYKNQVPWEVIKQSLKDNFGFWDSIQLNEKQEASLKKVYDESFSGKEIDLTQSEYQQDEPLAAEAKRILDDIALVGWTSGGTQEVMSPYSLSEPAPNYSKAASTIPKFR